MLTTALGNPGLLFIKAPEQASNSIFRNGGNTAK
jgi:hypothetical protein